MTCHSDPERSEGEESRSGLGRIALGVDHLASPEEQTAVWDQIQKSVDAKMAADEL
jgi:hypothetical protein